MELTVRHTCQHGAHILPKLFEFTVLCGQFVRQLVQLICQFMICLARLTEQLKQILLFVRVVIGRGLIEVAHHAPSRLLGWLVGAVFSQVW